MSEWYDYINTQSGRLGFYDETLQYVALYTTENTISPANK